jgi:hypothetical protein
MLTNSEGGKVQPRLDHLFGRSIEKISTHEKQSALVLDGGYKIIVTDKRVKWPKDLTDHGGPFSSVEHYNPTTTRLHFGKLHVDVPSDKLLIYSPDHEECFDPFAAYVSDDLPPDPSAERISEGPTTPQEGTNGDEAQDGKAE